MNLYFEWSVYVAFAIITFISLFSLYLNIKEKILEGAEQKLGHENYWEEKRRWGYESRNLFYFITA